MKRIVRATIAGALTSLLFTAAATELAAQQAGAGAASKDTSISVAGSLKGKKVEWLPIAMGIPLTEEWTRVMKENLNPLGVEVTTHDPNWSSDAQSQAFAALIPQHPDLIVVQNLNVGALAKQIEIATKAGINVIQTNMQSNYRKGLFVGPDWYALGYTKGKALAEICGGADKSGKVAVIEGEPSADANVGMLKGVKDALAETPHVQIVADQAADWDANKAFAATTTILQQNADLCGIVGMWGVMASGSAQAIKQANLVGKVALVTSGEAVRSDCDNVESGLFSRYYSYNATRQGQTLADMIKLALETKMPAGSTTAWIFTPIVEIKNGPTYSKSLCFDLHK